jgi:predicted small secreted protein
MAGNRNRETTLKAAVLAGTAVALLSGCGNTWRGMGQDMEVMGRRIQDSTDPAPNAPPSQYDYYRADPQPYRGAY